MTRREKTLGSVLVSLIVVSLCVFGAEAYFARLHALDAKLARAERRISEAGLASRANSDPSKLRKNWTPAEIDSAAFLSQFASIARGAGWQVLATIQRGSKNKVLSYSVDLEGAPDRWTDLLSAISNWDRPVALEGISARAEREGKMTAELELGYEIP